MHNETLKESQLVPTAAPVATWRPEMEPDSEIDDSSKVLSKVF